MGVNTAIKDYLEEHGISQTWLAKKTGMKVKTVNDMVNGNRKVSAIDLAKISKALGISADVFLDNISLN